MVRKSMMQSKNPVELSRGVFYKLRKKERSKESAYFFNLIF